MQGFLCRVQHPIEYLFSKNLNMSLASWVALARLCQSRLGICSGFTKYGHVIWAWNQYKDSLISMMVSLISLMLDNISIQPMGEERYFIVYPRRVIRHTQSLFQLLMHARVKYLLTLYLQSTHHRPVNFFHRPQLK